jgi:hypothetical protein
MNRRLITTGALALALLALSGRTASAQYRGRDWNDEHRDSHHDNDFNRSHYPTFKDRDRQVTRDWYFRNRGHLGRGWSDRDRLSPEMERRLYRGARLDYALRNRIYWVPSDLARLYGPAPRGYRYAIIGGNVVLLDRDYFVRDMFRIDIRIH